MAQRTVLVGDPAVEIFDPEEPHGPRLSIALLGEAVRERWICHGCRGALGAPISGCLAVIERYDEHGHGASFALCEPCLWERLA